MLSYLELDFSNQLNLNSNILNVYAVVEIVPSTTSLD